MSDTNDTNNADHNNESTTTSTTPMLSSLPLVPEAVLKRKHDLDAMKAKKEYLAAAKPRGNRKVFSATSAKNVKVRKPESFIANARNRQFHTDRYRRVMKRSSSRGGGGGGQSFQKKKVVTKQVVLDDDDKDDTRYVKYAANSVGARYVFCLRVRADRGAPRCVKQILRRLRLRSVHTGVLLRYSETNAKLLRLVEPFVVYGVPSKTTVRDLIVRRGHGVNSGSSTTNTQPLDITPLSSNVVVERALGETTGMICIEDLVHEITTAEPPRHMDEAVGFLAPFRMNAPKSRFQKDTLGDKEETKYYGDKGELMDDYVRQML